MTTILCIRKDGQVVMAGDVQSTLTQAIVEKKLNKYTQASDLSRFIL